MRKVKEVTAMMPLYAGAGWLGALSMTLLWLAVLSMAAWGLVSLSPVAAATKLRQHIALDTSEERYASGDWPHRRAPAVGHCQ